MPRVGSLAGVVVAAAVAGILIVLLSAVHLLPQLRNPFAATTTVRSEPGAPGAGLAGFFTAAEMRSGGNYPE
jgi:hypothetical protein